VQISRRRSLRAVGTEDITKKKNSGIGHRGDSQPENFPKRSFFTVFAPEAGAVGGLKDRQPPPRKKKKQWEPFWKNKTFAQS